MKNILNLGFIGGGVNSTIGRMHYLASNLDNNWKLVSGVFSSNKKINSKSGKIYNIDKKRVYSSIEKFIKYESNILDAIVVLTPTPNHYEILKKLAKIKIPIICEKPLINSADQMHNLNKIFSKNDKLIKVTYNYTGYPILRELKEMIRFKKIGELKQFFFSMPQNAFISKTSRKIRPKKWRLSDKGYPNIFGDLASHLFNMCEFLFEKTPEKVFAKLFNHSKFNIIDNGYFLAEIKRNIFGQFLISKTSVGISNGLKIRIIGTKKTVEWIQENPERLLIYNLDGTKTVFDRSSASYEANKDRYNRYKPGHPSGFLEAFANIYFDIASEINSKKSSKYTFGLKSSQKISNFFDASIKSDKSGKWTKLK